ncbi:MAG: hypothetical protein JXB49_10465 [Bacteroidales bacterium]|nr:hypothetical protein [Bacteroidales bacterium]
MNIEYRELSSFKEFRECAKLQEKIFGLSDLDKISPLILNKYSKDFPPMGIAIGAFLENFDQTKMIGFLIIHATFIERSAYGMAIGILPEYQNGIYGNGLMRELYASLVRHNIDYLYGIYDPLEGNLGKFYHNLFGFYGIGFEQDCYEYSDEKEILKQAIPNDKIVFRWDIKSSRVIDRLNNKYEKVRLQDILDEYPIIDHDNFEDFDKVLVEIPYGCNRIEQSMDENILYWKMKLRHRLSTYLNERKYVITECLSGKLDGNKRLFYLLEKN